jgi:hypothetical protein
MPTEQWEAYQKAFEVHGNIRAGAKKGAKTKRQGNKIEAADEYYRSRISDFITAHNEGQSTAQIAAKAGLTVASMRASYLAYMTPEEQEALFGTGHVDEPEPEPPIVGTSDEEPEAPVAMTESPQDDEPEADEDEELSIPEEPKEWPMAPYEPPANDQNKDAA